MLKNWSRLVGEIHHNTIMSGNARMVSTYLWVVRMAMRVQVGCNFLRSFKSQQTFCQQAKLMVDLAKVHQCVTVA